MLQSKRKGKLIVFEGLDKSGKTSIIQELLHQNDYVYRKALSKDGLIGKLAHAYPSTGLFSLQLVVDSFKTRYLLKRGCTVLQDRYYPSIITFSDSGLNKLIGACAFWLFPKPDTYLYVTVSSAERLKRLSTDLGNKYHLALFGRPELIDERERRYAKFYSSYSGKKKMIDTSNVSLENAVNQVYQIISKNLSALDL